MKETAQKHAISDSERNRFLIKYCFEKGFKGSQISAMFDIPLSTVYKRGLVNIKRYVNFVAEIEEKRNSIHYKDNYYRVVNVSLAHNDMFVLFKNKEYITYASSRNELIDLIYKGI